MARLTDGTLRVVATLLQMAEHSPETSSRLLMPLARGFDYPCVYREGGDLSQRRTPTECRLSATALVTRQSFIGVKIMLQTASRENTSSAMHLTLVEEFALYIG